MDIVKEFAQTMELPSVMADKMSHDPDRDTRRIAALVSLLERHGMLRRVEAGRDTSYDWMIENLSSTSNTRKEFVLLAKPLIFELRSADMKFSECGKRVSIRQELESIWLTWPCGFEGVGLDVDTNDPVGSHQYCVRCGFSTLDDNVDNDRWRCGCPECGYVGYLLDVDGGPAG